VQRIGTVSLMWMATAEKFLESESPLPPSSCSLPFAVMVFGCFTVQRLFGLPVCAGFFLWIGSASLCPYLRSLSCRLSHQRVADSPTFSGSMRRVRWGLKSLQSGHQAVWLHVFMQSIVFGGSEGYRAFLSLCSTFVVRMSFWLIPLPSPCLTAVWFL